MHSTSEMIIAVVSSVFASSGFWMLLVKILDKKSALSRMTLGLGHDRIVYLCQKYIAADGLTQDEFENLHDYLFLPYVELGGNGSAKNLMDKVYALPIIPDRPHPHMHRKKPIPKEDTK